MLDNNLPVLFSSFNFSFASQKRKFYKWIKNDFLLHWGFIAAQTCQWFSICECAITRTASYKQNTFPSNSRPLKFDDKAMLWNSECGLEKKKN